MANCPSGFGHKKIERVSCWTYSEVTLGFRRGENHLWRRQSQRSRRLSWYCRRFAAGRRVLSLRKRPILIAAAIFVVVVGLVVTVVVMRLPATHGPILTLDQFFALSKDPQLAQFSSAHGVEWKEWDDEDAKDTANDRANDLYDWVLGSDYAFGSNEDTENISDCVSMIDTAVSHVTAAISDLSVSGGDAYDLTLFRMDDENGTPTRQQMSKCSSEAVASFDGLGLGENAHATVTTQSGAVVIRFGYEPQWDTAALIVYGNVVALAGTEEGGDWTSELDGFTTLLISAMDRVSK